MRRLLIALGTIAGLSFVVGCKDQNAKLRDERMELAKKQEKVNNDVADIRQDEAKDIAHRQDEAAKDIADKREEVADKRQDVAEAQHDVAQKNVNDSNMNGTVVGSLKSSLGSSLTVRDSRGLDFKMETNDSTRVTDNGRSVKLDDYHEGTQVRASYAVDGNDKVAKDVEILK